MADIKFACPSCHQHITCDELWCGQEIACPICQAPLTVPPKPAPKPAVRTTGSGQGHNALVPKPPAAPTPKLSIGAQANTEAPGAGLANRNIPIRNLAPEAKKKKNPVVKILTTIVVVAVLGVGGYYGFQWLMAMQAKSNAASDREMANADGGQVGHISELNSFLDATEPGGAGLGSIPRRQPSGAPRTPGAAGGQAMSADADDETADAGAAAPAEKPLPVIPPVYTLEAEAAKIPEGRVNGMISGTNFVAETVSIVPSTTTQVLKLTQGAEASPDREILVYLKLKAGEKLGGQKITVTKDTRNPAISSVMKRWKTNPRYAPTSKAFSGGFALKLELGQPGEGFIPGKIYLALPDTEQTVVAGVFKATSAQAYADPTAASAVASPVPPAGRNPAETEMMRRRYGR